MCPICPKKHSVLTGPIGSMAGPVTSPTISFGCYLPVEYFEDRNLKK